MKIDIRIRRWATIIITTLLFFRWDPVSTWIFLKCPQIEPMMLQGLGSGFEFESKLSNWFWENVQQHS